MQPNRLGRYLRYLREKKGLSTRQLARLLGITQTFISRLELGQRRTNPFKLWQFMKVLDGDFYYALAALCADLGVPEEVASSIAGEAWERINEEIASSGIP